MDIEINDIHTPGVIRDQKAYQLAPEIWTEAYNMISRNGRMEAIKGWSQVFGTPTIAPHFAIPLNTSTGTYWLYADLTQIAVYDGNSHSNISRVTPYAAPNTRAWNGTIIGGIPILNNGADIPQYWAGGSVATLMANLPNWTVGATAALIRTLGPYLVALNLTESGVNKPHLARWSSESPGPGSLPASWDVTDATVDAGEYDLSDVESGFIREAKLLGSKLFIYKDQSTWSMRFVGGRAVMGFDQYSTTMGILAPRCVTNTGDGKKQVVATLDDIVIHDGNRDPESVLDKRMRRTLFGAMDTTNYINSFMFTDIENNNIIFAYPEVGVEEPNRGLVFNYKEGTLTETDIGFCNATSGVVVASSAETWATAVGTWETDTTPWNSFSRRAVLLCDKANTKFHKWNDGYTRNGSTYESKLQRKGISIIGRKRGGEWIVNHKVLKFVSRVWPKSTGAEIQVRLGFQQTVDGDVEWGEYQSYDPSQNNWIDLVINGNAIAIEFYLEATAEWGLDGYKLELEQNGEF